MTARLLATAITVALLYLLWWAITDGADLWADLPGFLRSILGWLVVGGWIVESVGRLLCQ